MTQAVIRPCRLDECSTVLELWKDAEAVPTVSDTNATLEAFVREHGDEFLVAELDGRVVGTVIAGWDGWRANIYRLVVHPDYRRQGIARALVLDAERRLAAKGAMRIAIVAVQHDRNAVSFWDSLETYGYARDPRMIRYVKDL